MPKTKATDPSDEELTPEQSVIVDELLKARTIARGLFNLADSDTPTPEMTLGVYDRVFDVADEDDFDLDAEDEDDDKD